MPKSLPTFEEAYESTMQFCRAFSTIMDTNPLIYASLEKKHRLDLASIKMISSNFILGVGHEKCGCPGIVSMICHGKDWVCPTCQGYISKEDAKEIMRKDYDKMISMFTNLSITTK